jgi:hypothetical protein
MRKVSYGNWFEGEKLWRALTDIWTVTFMIFVGVNFVSHGRYEFMMAPMSVIYIGILGLYVGTKEFDRWYEEHEGRHPGELFVIAWTMVIFGLMLFAAWRPEYHLSSEAIATYIMVLSVFALTQKSKTLYKRKHRSKKA